MTSRAASSSLARVCEPPCALAMGIPTSWYRILVLGLTCQACDARAPPMFGSRGPYQPKHANVQRCCVLNADVRFGSWSCRNPRGLGHQRPIELAKLTPIGCDYALIAA